MTCQTHAEQGHLSSYESLYHETLDALVATCAASGERCERLASRSTHAALGSRCREHLDEAARRADSETLVVG